MSLYLQVRMRLHSWCTCTVGFLIPCPVVQPFLPLPLPLPQSLLTANSDTRESAADGLTELIDVASTDALKPFVVPITG